MILVLVAIELLVVAFASDCVGGPCQPGRELCGAPFQNAPKFHLMDQHGCGENDPNGPVFDPVHGVFHHFYQIHLAAAPGFGPDYGHFVSKDFVNWAALPVAIWNGLDSSVSPPRRTPYDNGAIYTGSAVVVNGAGPGGLPGVVQIYPGLCNKADWPGCATGTLLAQAVPAQYADDPLLTNWTKPSYNPIMENTERDPSTPWKTSSGEWRLRTYNSKVYGSASDADLLAGKWYEIGTSKDLRTCECPSLFPLPAPTPGFEQNYASALRAGTLPSHVHKTSCGGDFWQIGTYDEGAPNTTGTFYATPGWEDLFAPKRIDFGVFYASKDNEYPTRQGGKRRINWGWAVVPPASTQTLPRVITFNACARCLEQAPAEELTKLRSQAAYDKTDLHLYPFIRRELDLVDTMKQSETVVTYALPAQETNLTIFIGSLDCTINYVPRSHLLDSPYNEVEVGCGSSMDVLRLLPSEASIEIRVFSDWTFCEVYFQRGRVAITATNDMARGAKLALSSSSEVIVASVVVYPMNGIWVTADEVRKAPRIYSDSEPFFVVTG